MYRQVGMAEYIFQDILRPEHLPGDHILWEVLEDTQFTKVIRNDLVTQVQTMLTRLAVLFSYARADCRRCCYRAMLLTAKMSTIIIKKGSQELVTYSG